MNFQPTAGERLLWRGSPGQGIRFQAQDWFAVPFAIVWLGLVLTSFSADPKGALTNDAPGGFILPFFVLIGLYMLVGRFIIDMLARRRTDYVLTDRRAIIESGLFRRNMRSVNLAAAPEIRLSQERGGRGTIEFGGSTPFGMMPRGWPGMSHYLPPAFVMIDGASAVYTMILDAQRAAQGAR